MDGVVRYIFRVDFKPCYQLVNSPGDALSILGSSVSDRFWTNVGMSQDRIGVSATREVPEDSIRQTVGFELTNLNGLYQMEGGIPLDNFLEHPSLKVYEEVYSKLVDRFQLSKFERVGFRVLLLGGEAERFGASRTSFLQKTFDQAFIDKVSGRGAISDVAAVIEGAQPDGTGFRVTMGPSFEKDRERMTGTTIRGEHSPHSFAMDIDVFEHNIDFRHTSLYRWVKLKWPEILKFVSVMREQVVI